MITWTRIAAKVSELMMRHPLLAKYELAKFGDTIPAREVIGICEQLEWTEGELDKARDRLSSQCFTSRHGPEKKVCGGTAPGQGCGSQIKASLLPGRPDDRVAHHSMGRRQGAFT